MNIKIERPSLNRPTPEENIAIVDRWIADTCDKLNMFISQTNKEIEEMRTDAGTNN